MLLPEGNSVALLKDKVDLKTRDYLEGGSDFYQSGSKSQGLKHSLDSWEATNSLLSVQKFQEYVVRICVLRHKLISVKQYVAAPAF